MKRCPLCNKLSHPLAARCDCGHHFSDEADRKAFSLTRLVRIAFYTAPVLLVAALLGIQIYGGCQLDEAGARRCVVFGSDVTDTLALGWLLAVLLTVFGVLLWRSSRR
jgi:hypothetical protein